MPVSYDSSTGWITTYNGDPFHPDSPQFSVEVIAHSLSMQCRCNGHVRQFYSVAEHSMLVADLMDHLKLGDPFEGLMHDAAEAYIGDIPAPFKHKNPALKAFEDQIDGSMRKAFGLDPVKSAGCERADKMAYFIECYWLMPDKGTNSTDFYNLRPRALEFAEEFRPMCFAPGLAKANFLEYYRKLSLIHPNVPEIILWCPETA